MTQDVGPALAVALRAARDDRGLSVSDLASVSGVSRAMISKIERGDAQPTAALLARLAVALGTTLSELVARAEGDVVRVATRQDQPIWTDPGTGYLRRAVSPPASTSLEIVEVELPPGARVAYPWESYRFIDQQIWVLDGRLTFVEGGQVHDLGAGDCLQLGPPADCEFVNQTSSSCRYVVFIGKLPTTRRKVAEQDPA